MKKLFRRIKGIFYFIFMPTKSIPLTFRYKDEDLHLEENVEVDSEGEEATRLCYLSFNKDEKVVYFESVDYRRGDAFRVMFENLWVEGII